MGITVEAQPGTLPSKKRRAINAQPPIAKLNMDTMNPKTVIQRSGNDEKEVTPSHANASIFFKGYLDSPAKRSARL